MAALGTAAELKQAFDTRPIVEVQSPQPVAALEALDRLPEVEKTSLFGTAVHAVLRSAATSVERLAEAMNTAGVEVRSVSPVAPSLEDVFLDVVERVERAEAGQHAS
jgi:ABC-2 type transport system ATP-binding protein